LSSYVQYFDAFDPLPAYVAAASEPLLQSYA
jgi:hypothetical protein